MLLIIPFILKTNNYIYLLLGLIIFINVIFGELKYDKIKNRIFNLENQNVIVIANVISNKEEKEYVNKYVIKIEKVFFNNEVLSEFNNLKFILYVDKEGEFEYGDIVYIDCVLQNADTARNSDGFDYSRYLRQNKIYGICDVNSISRIKQTKGILNYIFKFKNNCISVIEKNFDIEKAAFLKGILLGDMTFISDELKTSFQKSNLAHVLAISGMHVVYIINVVDFLLDKIIFSKKIKNCLEIIFIIFFIIFTGSSVSCIRAGIMMILILISKNIYRLNDFYSNLFFSFCFVLIYNPYNIESVGMWLSFLGTLGLVIFKRKIENSNKIFNYILNNLYVSFTVQLLIFPIIVYCYNSISLTFFISNLLISFLVGPVLILGYLSIFVHKFKVIIIIENIFIEFIIKIAQFVSEFKLSNILVGTPSLVVVIIYYIILICFINREELRKYYIRLKSTKFLKQNYIKIALGKKNYFIMCKYIKIFLIIIFLIFIILVFYINSIKNKSLKINFLDVGQGDCTFIILPNGKNILIDGGDKTDNYDYGEKVVAPYLLDKNITTIDYMIVSHFDSDHVGGLLYIAENFKVKNILIGVQFEENNNLDNMLEIINQKETDLMILKANDKIKIDEECYIDVLFPIEGEEIENNSINNNSLVFKLVSRNISLLFTGDIEEEAEEKLIGVYGDKLKCDILKVAHHGSITSSTEEFIKHVNPKIALIGVRKR